MPQLISAGILLFKLKSTNLEVFLSHPGGPYFRNKDLGAWFIPKGLVNPGEELISAAQREFTEETGIIPHKPFYSLGDLRLKSGKKVYIWAAEAVGNPVFTKSNDFEMEWPPRSGKMQKFPETDRGEFFPIPLARKKIHPGQLEFLNRIEILTNQKPA